MHSSTMKTITENKLTLTPEKNKRNCQEVKDIYTINK